MGCATSRNAEENGDVGATFVREVFDEDVHDMYDFTGPVLGSGAFATVLRVKDRVSGVEYAIKQMDLSSIKDDQTTMRMLYGEIKGMKALNHPNIVRLQEVYQPKDEDVLYLVLDRLEGGSVNALRKQKGHLEEGFAAYIIAQVVDAVRYCHTQNIAHRDLKLSNCMFEDNSDTPIVKIIDFGLCAELKDGKTSSAFVGTMTYAAPEMVMKNTRHGLECDIWSIGVMAYTLLGGRLPFNAEDPGALQYQIKFSEQSYTDETWKGVSALCRDFIDKCLEKKPNKRMTAKQAQSHPWIKKANIQRERCPLSKDSMLALLKFQEKNLFEKVALELVAYSYEPSQIKELELRFREMDKAGKGEVSLVDFKAALMERRLAIVQKDNERRQQKQQQQQQQQQKQQQPPQDPKPPAVATDAGVDASTACVEGHPAAGKGKEGHVEEVIGGVGNAGWKQGAATTEAVAENGEGEKGAGSVGGEIDIKQQQKQEAATVVAGEPSSGPPEPPRETTGDATAGATRATTLSSDDANLDEPLRRLYRKQSSRTRTIGGLDEEGVERIFEAIDVDHSGTISITEFVAASLAKQQINTRSIKAAFNRLDHSRKGLITVADMSMYLGDSFDESMMEQYMRGISSREDGLVNLEDFSKCLKAHVLKREGTSSRGSSRRVTCESAGSSGRRTTDSTGRPNIS